MSNRIFYIRITEEPRDYQLSLGMHAYREATEKDFRNAGYVKREKVGVYYDGLFIRCRNCESILNDNDGTDYCAGCGSELDYSE
jgi:NADH pyrophosphatase NudC (nudix superfamily)